MYILSACAMLLLICYSGPEVELIDEINKYRLEQGITPLAINWEAARLARYKAEEMRLLDFFSHDSAVYGETGDMLVRFGILFSEAGVNIAMGQENVGEVVSAWFGSAGHRENLLNAAFTSAGAGISYDGDIAYWTLILLSPP